LENILIGENKVLKIADFGISKIKEIQSKPSVVTHDAVGTVLYMAPEVIKEQPHDNKIDVWAAGILLYYMVARKFPFNSTNQGTIGYKIASKKIKHQEI
jgi:serine/threonine protein kinase